MPAAVRKNKRKPPWDRAAPRSSGHQKLGAKGKAKARASARKAGRPYPNLVDNMRAARKKKTTKQSSRRA